MRLFIILILGLLSANCKTAKTTVTNWNTRTFTLFDTKDTINIKLTYFAKNSAYCYTKAIPYALLIGQTNNPNSSNIPKTITVLAKCDNNNYSLGQNLKVLPIADPTTQTTLRALYLTKDTTINKQTFHWLIGSENPAIWGRVL